MLNVPNRSCLRRLSARSLRASKTRNRIAVLAIALTALLFTGLCTIVLSINAGFQQANFRQVGGFSHGGFKYLTEEQFEQLRGDLRIKEWGLRRFLGMPKQAPFEKNHVEVGFSDANQAHWMFCDPIEGRLPAEGTNEAATDTEVLALLGVTPEPGAQFTLTFAVDGHETTQTFTLCGWWEKDEAIVANHVLIPESRVNAILQQTGVDPNTAEDGMTGSWNLDMMLQSGARRIESDLRAVLQDHGYQCDTPDENYIRIGINWGYTGAQISENLDPITVIGLTAAVLLILLTGYLIIYNVFQISVAGDIRFYGLLKTIGTTPRQLRRMIRDQALALSAAGIPIGLLLGWLLGGRLTPVVVERLNGVVPVVSADPCIFVFAALFALGTVLLSCRRPGRMAARVSPVEAVRYTEGSGKPRAKARRARAVRPLTMAWANLGRSRGKTAVTILSLSLAVVLLTATVTFTNSFDMDKYISQSIPVDFIAADASYFQVGTSWQGTDAALPASLIETVEARGGVTGGRVYGKTAPALEFVTEEHYRTIWGQWNDAQTLDTMVAGMERTPDGLLADRVQLYGMENAVLDHLTVLEGDLDRVRAGGQNCIAAVYSEDEYGKLVPDSHWARLGDTVTIRYVEEYEYYDPNTGAVYGAWENVPEGAPWRERAVEYRDVNYTVSALVSVPHALSYRYYGADEFVMGAADFVCDTGTADVMYYAFDMAQGGDEAGMESLLADYTAQVAPNLDYESKATYAAEFESFRSMFLLLGGALSLIVGLVGVLNFFNSILTGIIARRREFAVLQAVGMTRSQLAQMLLCEGVYTVLLALGASLLLSVAGTPLLGAVLETMFWFTSYRLTLLPVAVLLPVFLALGLGLPLLCCRRMVRQSVVERLRADE